MKPGLNGVRRIHLPFALPFPFIFALAAGAGLRLIAMLGYPGALWFAGDSYVYLGAALRPQPNLSKTTGYSVFLHALEPFHSLTLVAGPWARTTPPVVDPSYFSPRAYATLHAVDPDARWRALVSSSRSVMSALTRWTIRLSRLSPLSSFSASVVPLASLRMRYASNALLW